MDITAKDITIVVVTYKRQELLQELFDSFLALSVKPGNLVLVDNENAPVTKDMCNDLNAELAKIKADCEVHYLPQSDNLGGAGGFSKGAEYAYNLGSQWLWLMDDDVALLENAVADVVPWCQFGIEKEHRVLQVRRNNFDGTPFYWQYHFMPRLGIPNPVAPANWSTDEEFRKMNTACFEGGLFHRSIVSELGLPDARFFIYWDDTMYGYLASKITKPLLINVTAIRRTRTLEHVKIGRIRKLNSTSDMTRYYIMRNRGFIAQYVNLHGQYNPLIFNFGTFLTFSKEFIRLFITKSFHSGLPRLIKGMRDGKKIRKDANWQPYSEISPIK